MRFSRKWLWLAFLLPISFYCNGDAVSRALKALAKGKHQQVQKLLNKSLDKYPLNPGAHFVLSKLYLDASFTRHNLDSAHYFIELALDQTDLADSIESWPLEKSSLAHLDLNRQKLLIDSLAFSRARVIHTVEGYQHFIDLYQTANEYSRAITARDQLAFGQAEAANTYQSYLQFIQNYPKAEQIPLATERYHRLLFESMTSGGKLQDYVRFWNENPQSPYRERAEEQIFQLSCLDHQAVDYQQFIDDYPKSTFTRNARGILYHLNKSKVTTASWSTDSLLTAYNLESEPLVTTLENGKLGFMNFDGDIRINPQYESLPDSLHCNILTTDVLSVEKGGKWKIISRNGTVLWEELYDDYQDLGSGYLKIGKGNLWGLVHKGGWTVLPQEYQDIQLLELGLIAFKRDGLWGIASMAGRNLLPPVHRQLVEEGPFLLLQQNEWAVLNKKALIDGHLQGRTPDHSFEDWEILSQDHIMVFKDSFEGILDSDLNYQVPFSTHRIYEVDSASWLTKTAHGTLRFYGEALGSIPPDRYQDILASDHYVCLNRSGQWQVMEWDLQPVDEILYDSVTLIGKHYLLLISEESGNKLIFPGKNVLEVKPQQTLKLIRSPNHKQGFLQISGNGGLREVYNWQGEPIYRTWYYEVKPLNSDLMIIEKNRRQGVVDLKGDQLIKARYNSITSDESQGLNLWDRGRFGYYHLASGKLIRPQYQARLKLLDQHYFIAEKNGKSGMIDLNDRMVIPFEYDEIHIWSDSIAVLRTQRTYSLYNFMDKKFLYQDIKQWDWISDKHRKSAIVRINGGYGLMDNQEGLVIEPIYRDIINIGTNENPLFVAESQSSTSSGYQLTYYDRLFKPFRKLNLTSEEHAMLWCF